MADTPGQVDATLADILKPLREQRDRIVAELSDLHTLVTGKQDELRKVERVLRAADPTRKPGPKSSTGKPYPVSDGAVETLLAFLVAHGKQYANGDGFTAASLHRDIQADAGGPRYSTHTVYAALRALHERDQVRLVRRGTGGSRVYRLVAK